VQGQKLQATRCKSYFHDVKINFQTLKIYFHDVKIDFHVMKISFRTCREDFSVVTQRILGAGEKDLDAF